MVHHLALLIFVASTAVLGQAHGQSLPTEENMQAPTSGGELEELYDKDDQKAPAAPAPSAKSGATTKRPDVAPVPEAQTLSDLAKLAPFSDVAVIQRRFLPKTNRFELSAGAFTNLNNPFFSTYGLDLGAAYYIRERWALEAIADFSTSTANEVTTNLSQNRNITTTNLVTSNGFYGGAIKWNPVYGKMTWLNHSIVPFDLNFSVGGGVTSTVDGQDVATLHIGSSQVFAINKGMAIRWNFNWNVYQASATNTSGLKSTISQNDLDLGIGMSFYFPEASYR